MIKKKNIFVSIISAFIAYKLLRKINDLKLGLEYICTLYIKDKSISFKGYLDTGNLVRGINGEGVIIVHNSIINKILNTNLSYEIEDYNDYLHIYNNLPITIKDSLSYTFYNTTKEKQILPILRFDKIVITNKRKEKTVYNPYIGILGIDSSGALIPISTLK